MNTIEKPKVTITESPLDGTWVVEIDTDPDCPNADGEPEIRVYLNDDCIFENPPLAG
jgi:hypothetical protein